MPNLVKHTDDMERMKAQIAMRALLRAIPDEEKMSYEVSVASTCVLLQCDPSTLYEARRKRTDWEKKKQPIPPLDLASIPFIKKKQPVYTAFDLLAFIDKTAQARGLKLADQDNPRKYPGAVGAVLGFQTWLGAAGPKEQWPFAIQKDGRPLDLIAAQLAGEAAEDFEWLTIREFGERCANAASIAASSKEARSMRALTRKPQRASADPTSEKERGKQWDQPGGAI
ncbi:hypothetical protein DBR47_12275 [Paucibacter sp. KBW04]|uniref:hypothetical protein n=1 Tax=Paucibacter sp. KBW04 TaxID=2153361 RepID=UPI000F562876|nr:hypothetical protein [Paucibacter sp. KBW04]RQO58482.1 hypothetical protein DBR47_12275 [Paucibacter sp. KBW04]